MTDTAYSARESVTIVNQRGLHARASAKFVNAVAKLPGMETPRLNFRRVIAG